MRFYDYFTCSFKAAFNIKNAAAKLVKANPSIPSATLSPV